MKITFVSIAKSDGESWDVVKTTVKATEDTIKETTYPVDLCNEDAQVAEVVATEFARKKGIAYVTDTETVYTVMKIRGSYHLYELPPNDDSRATITEAKSINEAIAEVRKKALSNRAIFIEPQFKRVLTKPDY